MTGDSMTWRWMGIGEGQTKVEMEGWGGKVYEREGCELGGGQADDRDRVT